MPSTSIHTSTTPSNTPVAQAEVQCCVADTTAIAPNRTPIDDDDVSMFPTPPDSPEYLDKLRSIIPSEFHDLLVAFSPALASASATRSKYRHEIDTEPGKTPAFGKIYHLAPAEKETLRKWIDENLANGFIRQSDSPAGAPVLFVRKKSGEPRLCVDYRALNAITRKNRCALPLIDDALDQVSKSKCFTKLDLRGAYNLVRIKEGDEWKTAFRTHLGHFESVVMPFGLTNAPATFQSIMNDLFRDLIDIHVQVYLDDILVHTPNRSTNISIVRQVLRRLANNALYCKAEKCEFFADSVEYLGYQISSDGISMLPERVSAVVDWPMPTTLTELQAFLGFGNYSRRCIKNYSKLAKPLTQLTRKDNHPFKFPPDAVAAFGRLKQAFTSAPVLAHFDPDRQTRIEPDASLYACGAVLAQHNPVDNLWHPVAYHSRSFSPAEINYTVGDKELTAILSALETWRHYLLGLAEFDILTDHRNLAYFLAPQKDLKDRHHHAQLRLSRFHFNLKYRPGVENSKADALSRRSDLMKEGTHVQSQQITTVLQPISISSISSVTRRKSRVTDCNQVPADCPTDCQNRVRFSNLDLPNISNLDPDLLAAYKTALSGDSELMTVVNKPAAHPRYLVTDPLVYLDNRICVPRSEPLRTKILALAHDSCLSGHPGRDKTFDLVSRQFTWPTLRTDVASFVAECATCQRTKPTRRKPAGLLKPLPIPSRPWSSLSMDHISQLPDSQGYDAILVIVDRFSKMAHFIPAKTTDTAVDLADQFVNKIIRLHGFPNNIVSDRGTTFTSQFWKEVLRLAQVKPMFSTAFHPQTNGQTERINQILEQYLPQYTGHLQDDWRSLLPLAEFAHNNSRNSSTKQTPFFTCYGYHPRSEITISDSDVPASVDLAKRIQSAHDNARRNLVQAQQSYADSANNRRRSEPDYQVGQLVKLSRRNLPSNRPTDKLNDRFIGPLRILEIINPVAVRLELPPTMKIHPVFHVNLVEPWTTPSGAHPTHQPPPPPPADIVDGEAHYEVSKILDSRLRHRRLEYLVSWTGYDKSEDSWVPATEFDTDDPIILTFHATHPRAVRRQL